MPRIAATPWDAPRVGRCAACAREHANEGQVPAGCSGGEPSPGGSPGGSPGVHSQCRWRTARSGTCRCCRSHAALRGGGFLRRPHLVQLRRTAARPDEQTKQTTKLPTKRTNERTNKPGAFLLPQTEPPAVRAGLAQLAMQRRGRRVEALAAARRRKGAERRTHERMVHVGAPRGSLAAARAAPLSLPAGQGLQLTRYAVLRHAAHRAYVRACVRAAAPHVASCWQHKGG